MNTLSREKIVKWFESQRYRFTELTLVSEGDYAVQDADWNYKDLPHIHHVHPLAEQLQFVVGSSVMSAIQLQGVLKIWFPMLSVAYEVDKFRQVYVQTLFFFAIIIETSSEAIGEIRTRVTTTYSIGCPKLWFLFTPLLKWAIQRNYRILMSDDIPMRERRGALRKIGYTFRMSGETYGFEETTRLMENRLQAPPHADRRVTCRYKELFAESNEGHIGDIGLLGFRLVRATSEVMVFPRACPHEGANLDESRCVSGAVVCRWHGRRIRPIGKFTWGQNAEFVNGPDRGRVVGEELTIEYDDSAASLFQSDVELSA